MRSIFSAVSSVQGHVRHTAEHNFGISKNMAHVVAGYTCFTAVGAWETVRAVAGNVGTMRRSFRAQREADRAMCSAQDFAFRSERMLDTQVAENGEILDIAHRVDERRRLAASEFDAAVSDLQENIAGAVRDTVDHAMAVPRTLLFCAKQFRL